MVFRKLKRVWSHNDMKYIPKFTETFPELNKVSSEEMCERWISLGIDFYTEEKTEVKGWIRLTLPFALILFVLPDQADKVLIPLTQPFALPTCLLV